MSGKETEKSKNVTLPYLAALALASSFVLYVAQLQPSEEVEVQETQTVSVDFHYLDKNDVYKSHEYSYQQDMPESGEEHKKILIRSEGYRSNSVYCELPAYTSQYDCQEYTTLSDDQKQEVLAHFMQSDFFDKEETNEIPNVLMARTNNDETAPKQGVSWNVYTDKSAAFNTRSNWLKKSAFKLTRTAKAVPRSQEVVNYEIDLAAETYCKTEQASGGYLEAYGHSQEKNNAYYKKTCKNFREMSLASIQNLFADFNAQSLKARHVDHSGTAILSATPTAAKGRDYKMTWAR